MLESSSFKPSTAAAEVSMFLESFWISTSVISFKVYIDQKKDTRTHTCTHTHTHARTRTRTHAHARTHEEAREAKGVPMVDFVSMALVGLRGFFQGMHKTAQWPGTARNTRA